MRWILSDFRGAHRALKNPHPSLEDLKDEIGSPELLHRYTEPSPSCLKFIVDQPPISRPARLAIYAEAYFLRLRDALGAQFRVAKRSLGEERFYKLIADYLEMFPSRGPSIEEVGRFLPEFTQSHWLNFEFPFLADLVNFEWNVLHSFLAADTPPLEPAKLEQLQTEDPEQWYLELDSAIRVIHVEWPIDSLCEEFTNPTDMLAEKITLLIYRLDNATRFRRLGLVEATILQLIREGFSLGQVGERALAKLEGAADFETIRQTFATCFGEWMALGLIRDVRPESVAAH